MPPSIRAPGRLPSTACITSTTPAYHPTSALSQQQVRHATLIKRPKRPYTFTQLIALSDGSTFVHRTSSPTPLYRSTRDTRNTPAWNPSNARLANVEEDEAGRLRAFRRRFGRAFDAASLDGPSPTAPPSSASPAEAPAAAPRDPAATPTQPIAPDAPAKQKAAADTKEGVEEQKRSDAPAESGVAGAAKPPPAAVKEQEQAAPRGAGSGTTASSGMEDAEEEDDNLMDLLNQYAGDQTKQGGQYPQIVQKGSGAEGGGRRGKGKKR